jgi:hypothetical protein
MTDTAMTATFVATVTLIAAAGTTTTMHASSMIAATRCQSPAAAAKIERIEQ